MDIHIPAGSVTQQTEDVFGVVIQVRTNAPGLSSIKLVHYERTSAYAPYAQCRDTGVDGDLCVCSSSDSSKRTRNWHLHPPIVFSFETKVVSLNTDLYMYERRTLYGLILETSCDSLNTVYKLQIIIGYQENVVFSKVYPLKLIVRPGNMLFVDSFYQRDPKMRWNFQYLATFVYVG